MEKGLVVLTEHVEVVINTNNSSFGIIFFQNINNTKRTFLKVSVFPSFYIRVF